MKVLPDGSVVFVELNAPNAASSDVAKMTAKAHLDEMIARKQEIDYMASAMSIAGMELGPEFEKEYIQLCRDIDEALKIKD
jgi:hypothetical protein